MTYTKDFFTNKISLFETMLSHLVGVPCAALEIGTLEGRCAVWLLNHILTHPESHIICVDILPPKFQDTLNENLAPYKNARVIGKDSRVALHELVSQPVRFAFAYIDGGHQDYIPLHDLVVVHELLVSGGVIAIDDYLLPEDSFGPVCVRRCTDAFMKCYGEHYHIMHHEYQVWLRKKIL